MIENQQLCEVDGVQSTMGSERFGMLSSPSLTLSDMSTDTPRNPVEAGASPWFLPPVSPGNHRRTKSRAGHIGHRQNSLTESKVSRCMQRGPILCGVVVFSWRLAAVLW